MLLFVVKQVVEGGKAGLAISKVTFEWFLPIMHSHMSEQISFLSKGLFAVIFRAHEWSLTSLHTICQK